MLEFSDRTFGALISTSPPLPPCRLQRGAGNRLHQAGFEFPAHHDALRDADQVGIFELDAGTLVTVVEQGVETRGEAIAVNGVGGLALGGIAVVGRGDDNIEGAMAGGHTRPLAS